MSNHTSVDSTETLWERKTLSSPLSTNHGLTCSESTETLYVKTRKPLPALPISTEQIVGADQNELELLYQKLHMPLIENRLPEGNSVQITIKKLDIPIPNLFLKLEIGTQCCVSSSVSPLSGEFQSFTFHLTLHSIFFDTLKVSVYESRSSFSSKCIGTVRIRLNKLQVIGYECQQSFPILPKKSHIPYQGNLQLLFTDHEQHETFQMGQLQKALDSEYPASPTSLFDKTRPRANSNVSIKSTSSTINSGSSLGRRSLKRNQIFSERTQLGIKDLNELFKSFIKDDGIKGTELVSSIALLSRYFHRHHPMEYTRDFISDIAVFQRARYWMNFAMSTYNSLMMNYFGGGKGIIDLFRLNSDYKVALEHLQIPPCDMLVWEYKTGLEMFKPKFFICRDKRTDSIVISIRGTADIHDCLTDCCAQYEPFKGGFAHRGVLRSAAWIIEHYLDEIIGYVAEYQPSAIYVVGHSLGGAIAVVVTMMLMEHSDRLLSLNPKFKTLYSIGHGTPPMFDYKLAKQCEAFVDTFVNEYDVVPRLSFGVLADMKDLVKTANEAIKSGKSREEKVKSLNDRYIELQASNEHPKMYLPGNIYYLYKTSRMKEGDECEEVEVEDERSHYVMEKSDCKKFLSLPVWNKLNHHFPNNYIKAVEKSEKWVAGIN